MERLIYSSPFSVSFLFSPLYSNIERENIFSYLQQKSRSRSSKKVNHIIYIYIFFSIYIYTHTSKKKQRTWIVNENPLWVIFHDFSSPLVQLCCTRKITSTKRILHSANNSSPKNKNKNFLIFLKNFSQKKKRKNDRKYFTYNTFVRLFVTL